MYNCSPSPTSSYYDGTLRCPFVFKREILRFEIPSSSSSSSSSAPVSSGGIIAAILFGVVTGTFVALYAWRLQIKRSQSNDDGAGGNEYMAIIHEVERIFEDRHPNASAVLSMSFFSECVLKRHEVHMLQQVKSGHFGTVHRATVGKHDISLFALRLFKSMSTFHTAVLLSEAFILTQIEHESITYSLGFVAKKKPVIITMEWYPTLSLKDLLIERKLVQFGPQVLTPTKLLDIARAIASAMLLLHRHGIVNGALGAHQLLATPEGEVKIYQFARPISSTSLTPLIKPAWKPLEMLDGSSVLMSQTVDLWQFGVLLWQILSYGAEPFDGLNDSEVLSALQSNKGLRRPQGCSKRVYEIMEKCWSRVSERPTFNDHMSMLEGELNKFNDGRTGKFRHSLNKKYNFGLATTA
eukprot:m.191850 g.191850  ORF g.191850 m.191850 type:complete len:410 (+) comp13647_c2_seq11:5994-7223(+)